MNNDKIFDTLFDTNNIYVAIRANFKLREYKHSKGTTPVFLSITGNSQRERLSLSINIDTKQWDRVKSRLYPNSDANRDINLILDNIEAKITAIKTSYRLSERVLTPAVLKKEMISGMPRLSFTAFFNTMLEDERPTMAAGSYRRHKSVLKKINTYDPDVNFMDIDFMWLEKYRRYLAKIGNQKTTIAANIASIKKYLLMAIKSGIKLKINIDEIKAGSTKGNRTSLKANELKMLADFYFSNYINDSYKLILGYFLFSCMTGLRISDMQKLERKNFENNYINFISTKTNKNQQISLNETAQRIISHEPKLFMVKFTDQHINDKLKKIMKFIGITKIVTFHVARHTFATSFLRAGGKVEKLQILLGHSSISQTMIYAHIVESEANSEIHLLDNLFN